MTKEEKDLLLKDLCARLPYDVKVHAKFIDTNTKVEKSGVLSMIDADAVVAFTSDDTNSYNYVTIHEVKPYLFPLSSMPYEMIEELNANGFFKYRDTFANVSHLISNGKITKEVYTYIDIEDISYLIELFHKHHIDYRGLIEKGLAIDCTNLDIY